MDDKRYYEITKLLSLTCPEALPNKLLIKQADIALTHISSGKAKNFERLEFLGDAVLRLAATEFIDQNFPNLSVGFCSNLRAQLVSDRWLSNIGAKLEIEQYLVLGRYAQGDHSAKSRLRADATEALIGAVYSTLGNFEAIHRWLGPHWHSTAQALLAAPHKYNGKTALQGGARARAGTAQLRPKNAAANRRPRTFRCRVSIQSQDRRRPKADPEGAEQSAATAALQALEGSDAPQHRSDGHPCGAPDARTCCRPAQRLPLLTAHPGVRIPVGMAMMPKPKSITEASSRPSSVWGTTSPYPTVVMVTIAQ